jgi:hypothetical protein
MEKSKLRQLIREEISSMVNLEKFEKLLKSHDWYYRMSDDPSVYKRGEANWEQIKKMAIKLEDTPGAKELWDKYSQDMPYSNKKFPYPTFA